MTTSPRWRFRNGSTVFDLRPGIPERDRPVEHQRSRPRIQGVAGKIPDTLELVPRAVWVPSHARLDLGPADDHQGFGVEHAEEILPLLHCIRIRHAKEFVVQPEVAIERVWRRDPVDGALDLTTVRRIATARRRIVGTPQLDDIA